MSTSSVPLWARFIEDAFHIIGAILAISILAATIVATGAIVVFL